MDLPVMPPVAPMLAKSAPEVPTGRWSYEPKWDGFRCIVFRDGDEVELGSRNGRSLTRYFPELVADLRAVLPPRVVLDGEIVIASDAGLDFDVLSNRIHPAASRVEMLAASTPASFVAFDLLAVGDDDLRGAAFTARRRALEAAVPVGPSAGPSAGGGSGAGHRIHRTPVTTDPAVAADWFHRFEGAGLDGVVAKDLDGLYLVDKRAMIKVKHERTAEFVVGGFRWYKGSEDAVGSLMLGIWNGDRLSHVGVIGSFPAAQRRDLVAHLAPYREPASHPWAEWASADGGSDHARQPGATSRWNATKDLGFVPLAPELVVEAAYEHLQHGRLRHTARFRRWRPDRDPVSCTYDQLEVAVPALLAEVFSA